MYKVPTHTAREAFQACYLRPRKHRLLGRTLDPLCLDHLDILEAMRSPLLLGGEVRIEDIQLAVLACSLPSNEAFFAAALNPPLRWRLWYRLTARLAVEANVPLFRAFMDGSMPPFPFWDAPGGDTETRCPPFHVLASRFIGGMDPARIRRLPIGELVAWSLARNEADGRPPDSLMSDIELAAVRIANASQPSTGDSRG